MTKITPVKYDATAKTHTPLQEGDVIPGANVQLSADGNNLLRNVGDGLLVTFTSAPDIAEQYVSSSTGSDTTGDGSQDKPFKTLAHAFGRIPDYTSSIIYLKTGDTFRPEDGVSGYVLGGTLAQHTVANLYVGNRAITIQPYDSANFTTMAAVPGVDIAIYEIGVQPVIIFTASANSDVAGEYSAPGFGMGNGSLILNQITLKVEGSNIPAGSTSLSTAPIAPWGGTITLGGCNIFLGNLTLVSGPITNTAESVLIAHYCRFDTSGGMSYVDGQCGLTLKADFADSDGSAVLPGGSGIKARVTNFNADIAAHGSSTFPRLSVLSAEARTYQGLTTTNALLAEA